MPDSHVSRRAFLGASAGAAATAASFGANPEPTRQDRPNFVVVFTDDQRWDAVGAMGNPVIHTPAQDRLAREGVVFERAFVTTSICCVSRACVLSGQHSRRHGIHDFFTMFEPEALRQTYPAVLGRAGYETGFIGKWGIGDSPEKTRQGAGAFDFWAGQPHQTNFWHEADCPVVTDHGPDVLCDCPADARGVAGPGIRIGKENLRNPVHLCTEIVPRKVDEFLSGRDADRPFCLSVFSKAPHGPWGDWDPAVEDLHAGETLPVPPTATETWLAQRPAFLGAHLGSKTAERWIRNPEQFQRNVRDYYRLVSTLDLSIARIREQLAAHGVADNTVIILTSDNGHFLGEHGLMGKWIMREPSIRVPFIVFDPRAPRAQRGQRRREMALTIDVAATLLDMAGVQAPAAMQGLSLAPLAAGKDVPWRSDWFYEHQYHHGRQIEPTEGVRTERWKYTRYTAQEPVYEELFDLAADPHETRNLALASPQPAVLPELRVRCGELAAQAG